MAGPITMIFYLVKVWTLFWEFKWCTIPCCPVSCMLQRQTRGTLRGKGALSLCKGIFSHSMKSAQQLWIQLPIALCSSPLGEGIVVWRKGRWKGPLCRTIRPPRRIERTLYAERVEFPLGKEQQKWISIEAWYNWTANELRLHWVGMPIKFYISGLITSVCTSSMRSWFFWVFFTRPNMVFLSILKG